MTLKDKEKRLAHSYLKRGLFFALIEKLTFREFCKRGQIALWSFAAVDSLRTGAWRKRADTR
jgi:hypothetical protein